MDWDAPWAVVAGALFVIVCLRAGATYTAGRLMTAGAAHTRLRRLIGSRGYLLAHRLLDRWGPPVVAVSFLTIGFQTVMNLAAGVTRMPLRHYLPAMVVGGALWAMVYASVGLVSLHVWGLLWGRSPAVAIAAAVLAAAALAWFLVTAMRSRQGSPQVR